MSIENLRNRYQAIYGLEPTDNGVIEQVEKQLGVKLPDDLKEISQFYRGGILGAISHNAIESPGGIVYETQQLRKSVNLPHSLIVIAEPDESLIVMDTDKSNTTWTVIWIDSFDVGRLSDFKALTKPHIWKSYADFFQFLLDSEKEIR